MNSFNPCRLARTCWIALVAMLSLVLLPVMSEALAAPSPHTAAWHGLGNMGPTGIELGDDVDDESLGLEGDAVQECLLASVPAALPAAPPARLPAPALNEEQVRWPEGRQRAAWCPHTWPASLSRGPPRPGR